MSVKIAEMILKVEKVANQGYRYFAQENVQGFTMVAR